MSRNNTNVVDLASKKSAERPNLANKSNIVAALDVGSTKICCLIGEIAPTPSRGAAETDQGKFIRILGVGQQISQGVRNGVVNNVDAAERAIRLAVDAAERMAGITIAEVFVNISGGRPKCTGTRAAVTIGGERISAVDIDAVIEAALAKVDPGERVVLHATPGQYELDEARGVKDPLGMFARELRVDLSTVLVEPAALRNLQLVIERCHLDVAGFVMAPYAASRAVLAEDERELGVTLIDLGGATTSVAVLIEGNLVFADMVPIGGKHITADLARGLSTSLAHAERLKTLYGSVIPSMSDDRDTVSVPLLGENGPDRMHRVRLSMLTGIIRPRVEEIFEVIRDRLEQCPDAARAGRRVVLAGGGAELTGLRDLAAQLLDKHVRIGTPYAVSGLPDVARSGAFAVASGLMQYALEPDKKTAHWSETGLAGRNRQGYFSRMGKWIRESF